LKKVTKTEIVIVVRVNMADRLFVDTPQTLQTFISHIIKLYHITTSHADILGIIVTLSIKWWKTLASLLTFITHSID